MRNICLIFSLCLPFSGHGLTLQVEARAATEQQAKREALAALADSILVEVKSEFSSIVKGSGDRQDIHRISSHSDIPLLGAELSCAPQGREMLCEARLDSGKSLVIYTRKLDALRREMAELDARISRSPPSSRYAQLLQSLTLAEQYAKYRTVAHLLGAAQLTPPATSRSDIEAQLRALEKLAPSLDIAAQLIAQGVNSEALYIYAAVPQGSHEVTALGRVMRNKLAQHLKAVSNLEQATHFFKGEYEQLNHGLLLTYRLLDIAGNTLQTRIVTLAPTAYQGIQTKAASIDFDRLLHEGLVQSNAFKVMLNSNRGAENILFDAGDEVELFVKLSRPAYFYVVGHIVKKEENYSYLLELSHTLSDRRFIRYANADDVNKWLNLGRFEVSAPFGIESLQLIASSDDPVYRLPSHQQDSVTGLFIIAHDAQQGISKTRALKPKRSDSDKNYHSESVLIFTTMPKP